jgi:hypothetical protein|tara:strand:+ start:19 stop:933 length:915 start_codon:yes stop_codon:yes gene_type:complete
MSFAALKKQSRSGSLTERLMKKVEKLNEKGNNTDERLWKPAVDKAGNGYAVIRFLPAHANCELPWTQVWSHAFQGTGGWYIENSLTTIGKDDPVGELNRSLWNSGRESDKDIARKQKRKLSYYANVYVVKDSINPENEGEVKLYKFGKKIFDKITAAMQPEFDDEEAINPFDFWQGANFKLKIKQVAGFWNYDSSEFGKTEALLDDDAELEKIYDKIYDLSEFTAPDQFKTYEQLKSRLDTVLGTKQVVTPTRRIADEDLEDLSEGKGATVDEELANLSAAATASATDEEEDDALSYFQKLAEE